MKKLDDPQKRIYDYIVSYSEQHAYPPSVREICHAVGLRSTSTVHTHLKNMQLKGMISRDSSKQRAMVVREKPAAQSGREVPLVGCVAAGVPILAVENIVDTFPLPEMLLKGGQPDEVFMLRVRGDSMIDAGIRENDVIVVNRSLQCEDGDIVVALVQNETATVKRLFRERDHVRLQPENSFYEPILVPYDEVELVGKVVSLLRLF